MVQSVSMDKQFQNLVKKQREENVVGQDVPASLSISIDDMIVEVTNHFTSPGTYCLTWKLTNTSLKYRNGQIELESKSQHSADLVHQTEIILGMCL